MTTVLVTRSSFLPQVAYAAASITNAYTLAGSFNSPIAELLIVSTLDQPVQVSFDGTTDHVAVPAGSTVPVALPFSFTANLGELAARTPVYVKEIGNPTVGSIYFSAYSNSNG